MTATTTNWTHRVETKRQWLHQVQSTLPPAILYQPRRHLSGQALCHAVQQSPLLSFLRLSPPVTFGPMPQPQPQPQPHEGIQPLHHGRGDGESGGHGDGESGGHGRPTVVVETIIWHKHAIVVPYRDRAAQLQQFIPFLSQYLDAQYKNKPQQQPQRWWWRNDTDNKGYTATTVNRTRSLPNQPHPNPQQPEQQQQQQPEQPEHHHRHVFTLYLMEQDDDELFNRAMLLNAGLDHVDPDTECVILHDVDVLPAVRHMGSGNRARRVPYHACRRPTHLVGALVVPSSPPPPQQEHELDHTTNSRRGGGRGRRRRRQRSANPKYHSNGTLLSSSSFYLPYPHFAGAVFSMHQYHWAAINGMDHQMQGYGYEDDDLFVRLLFLGLVNCSTSAVNRSSYPQPYRSHGSYFTDIQVVVNDDDGDEHETNNKNHTSAPAAAASPQQEEPIDRQRRRRQRRRRHVLRPHTRGIRNAAALESNRRRHLQYLQTGLSPSVIASGGWRQTNYHITSRRAVRLEEWGAAEAPPGQPPHEEWNRPETTNDNKDKDKDDDTNHGHQDTTMPYYSKGGGGLDKIFYHIQVQVDTSRLEQCFVHCVPRASSL
ncbi:hypothetical protein ACA910_012523 [Epithemia clementina (nom. ined.)]